MQKERALEIRSASAKELSEVTGVSANAWMMIFHGHRRPSVQTLVKASDALNIGVDEVIHQIKERRTLESERKQIA